MATVDVPSRKKTLRDLLIEDIKSKRNSNLEIIGHIDIRRDVFDQYLRSISVDYDEGGIQDVKLFGYPVKIVDNTHENYMWEVVCFPVCCDICGNDNLYYDSGEEEVFCPLCQ